MKHYHFKPDRILEDIISWLWSWFKNNGYGCNAIINVDGTINSVLNAHICTKTLDPAHVYGIILNNNDDTKIIEHAKKITDYFDIEAIEVNIDDYYDGMINEISNQGVELKYKSTINFDKRCRLPIIYAISESLNGRVIGNLDLTRKHIGEFTKWNNICDVSILSQLTSDEIKELVNHIEIPDDLYYNDKEFIEIEDASENVVSLSFSIINQFIRDINPSERPKQLEYYIEKIRHKMSSVSVQSFKPNILDLYDIETKE